MNKSDYGEGAPERQPQMPAVIPGGLYTRRQIIHNLGVSPGTFGEWVKAGLPVRELGTKSHYVLADDLIEFIKKAKG